MKRFFNKKNIISMFAVFFVCLIFFGLIEYSTDKLACVDVYYHTKVAQLVEENGVLKTFPWLSYTILSGNFVDHHFLFHVLIVPFGTSLLDIKLFIIIFTAVTFVVFYLFLKSRNIKFPFLWIIILAISSAPFLFVINLGRPQSLSLIFLIIGLYFLIRRKWYFLGIISFLYVWLYNAFPLIIILTFIYSAIYFFINKKWSIKAIASCIFGILAGITINPYFPHNIYFYWEHIVKIGILKPPIEVGIGWYPYRLSYLVDSQALLFFIWFISIIFFIVYNKKDFLLLFRNRLYNNDILLLNLLLFLFSLFLFLCVLKARRFVDHWVPFTVLFSALALDPFFKSQPFSIIKEYIFKNKIVLVSTICFIMSIFAVFGTYNISSVIAQIQNSLPYDKYKDASEWLINNTPQGSIVFHGDWDDFPQLFFYNHHNYYIVGMDPTFMYEYKKDLYWKWRNITSGQEKENMYDIIKNDFNSRYVFVADEQRAFRDNLESDKKFKKVFDDGKTAVFEL